MGKTVCKIRQQNIHRDSLAGQNHGGNVRLLHWCPEVVYTVAKRNNVPVPLPRMGWHPVVPPTSRVTSLSHLTFVCLHSLLCKMGMMVLTSVMGKAYMSWKERLLSVEVRHCRFAPDRPSRLDPLFHHSAALGKSLNRCPSASSSIK